jgi:hypothetical protein
LIESKTSTMAAQISLSREQYLDAIRNLCDSANELADRLNMNQMTWQPAGGERWSITECLDHLAISTTIYLDAMQLAIAGARSGSDAAIFHTAGFPSAGFTRSIEPPPRIRFSAPGKIRPRATLNQEAILPRFIQAMDRVSALVMSTSGRDLNAVRFRNPFLPLVRFTVSTGFLIIAAHGRRHLRQAELVTREPGFPQP